jgi:hypothetical protein
LGGAILGFAALLFGSATQALAESSADNAVAVQSAADNGSLGGTALKWLSRRPASVQDDGQVVATGYNGASAKSPRPLQMAQKQDSKPAGSRYRSPFDNKEKKAAPAEKTIPPEPLTEDLSTQAPKVLEAPPAEPKRQNAMPSPSPEEPAPLEKPYVGPNNLPPLNAPIRDKAPARDKNGQKPSSPEQNFAPQSHEFKEDCPSAKDLKHISELTTNITPSEGDLPHDCPLGNGASFQGRSFAPLTFTWTASALCHKPLYFEDVQLERYGHMSGPISQPFFSAANFFLTFPVLPYKMGLETPDECMYPLGYYRPGNCAPYLFDPFPLSVRAAFFEAGAWVGGVAAM